MRAGLCILLVWAGGAVAQPFSEDVDRAVDRGLAWLVANGAFQDPSLAGDAAGVAALAMLERREGEAFAPAVGYDGASDEDRGRLDQIFGHILRQALAEDFYAYRDGVDLMALSVYLRTGGARRLDAVAAVNVVVDRVVENQGEHGYWTGSNGATRDSSATQLVMAGLGAARAVYGDPEFADADRLATLDAATALARAAYAANGLAGGLDERERGHGYQQGNLPSLQQTASGLWCQVIGGADLNDDGVQAYLRWLYHRYNYGSIEAADGSHRTSLLYYLWASTRAYTFLDASRVVAAPGNLPPSALGTLPADAAPAYATRSLHRVPEDDPRPPAFGVEGAGFYAETEPGWYYDHAYSLLAIQDGGGRFVPPGGVWNDFAGQAYALLVLERSVGGGCVDHDGDHACLGFDNCPEVANPDQADRDEDGYGDACDGCPEVADDQRDGDLDGAGDACDVCLDLADDQADGDEDGVGDACDNCPAQPNPEQGDRDENGVGDFCDVGCEDGPFEEVCNQLDDDCDGATDEGLEGCGCVEEEIACDGIDEDCDDAVDEGLHNACGECGPLPEEICNRGDDDCDGDIDEGVQNACGGCGEVPVEVCNREDDDCDGATDEGVQNACGACGEPPIEVCNREDDDCDGATDEGVQNACGACGEVPDEVCKHNDDD